MNDLSELKKSILFRSTDGREISFSIYENYLASKIGNYIVKFSRTRFGADPGIYVADITGEKRYRYTRIKDGRKKARHKRPEKWPESLIRDMLKIALEKIEELENIMVERDE